MLHDVKQSMGIIPDILWLEAVRFVRFVENNSGHLRLFDVRLERHFLSWMRFSPGKIGPVMTARDSILRTLEQNRRNLGLLIVAEALRFHPLNITRRRGDRRCCESWDASRVDF